ncbi:MAG: hypothetical protein WKG32_02895 [Gemmatimonadaceae bacterium]
MPVVLVYLGFLNAAEMRGRGKPFASASDWEKQVRSHSEKLVPADVWERPQSIGDITFVATIRSRDVPLQPAGAPPGMR